MISEELERVGKNIQNKNMPEKKQSYKDRNGTTRVGDALRWLADQGKTIAPELLSVAGQVTNIKALEDLGDKIRGESGLSDFDKQILLGQLALDKEEMQSISNRWNSDMVSDSWLSKNIRPMTLAFLLICMFVFVMLDSSIEGFVVAKEWVELLKNLLITVCLAYFGSRGIEKFKKISK